jgi:hypothetical protein
MKKRLALTLFVLTSALCYAQNNGAWLIPRIVYVGDTAMLILPLPPAPSDAGDIVIGAQSRDLSTENIEFHRITLERRVSGNRLLVEFTAFMPGTIELPIIEIGGESFSGLTVTISSIVDTSRAPELSGAAPTLAMPGTAMMLYGTMAAIVFLLLFAVWFSFRGRHLLQKIIEKWRRWGLFIFMRKTEKNLQKLLLKGGNQREILDKLSDEFRAFLSFFSGNNCQTMTAREFENLTSTIHIDGVFLRNFFRRCDNLRFSGADVKNDDIKRLLADLRTFLTAAEKERAA